MSVRGGVNYSQINEKFTFAQGNLVQVTYIINASGDTVGSYTTTGTRYKTTINKYRSIDVPLVIGYELGNGKLHATINAGAIVNIYSWQKGEILDTALNPVNITTGKGSSPYMARAFAQRLPAAIDELPRECGYLVLLKTAVAGSTPSTVDLTPQLRRKVETP